MDEIEASRVRYNRTVGARARAIRLRQHRSLADVAASAASLGIKGMSESKIAQIERGEVDISPRYLARIARLLGVQDRELLDWLWLPEAAGPELPHEPGTLSQAG